MPATIVSPRAWVFRSGVSFSPSDVSAVSAWLRVANATSDGDGISSVPDVLNTNPAVQSVNDRKPVIENSANGLPCMRFATNDVLAWPITAQSSAINQAGWGLWVKADGVAATQRLLAVSIGTNGASGNKLILTVTSSGGMSQFGSGDGATNRNYSTAGGTLTTAWHFVTVEYDKDGATDADRLIATIDGVSQTGTVAGTGNISAGLFAATGNILIGNLNDGVASSPYNGLLGPNIYSFAAKMPGAEFGLLTSAARAALMAFEAPT
jgi:hypothetical protein